MVASSALFLRTERLFVGKIGVLPYRLLSALRSFAPSALSLLNRGFRMDRVCQLPTMHPSEVFVSVSSSGPLRENSVTTEGLRYGYSMQDPQVIARHEGVTMQGSTVPASPRKRLDVKMRLRRPSQEDWHRWRHDIVRLYQKEPAPAIVRRLRLSGYNVT